MAPAEGQGDRVHRRALEAGAWLNLVMIVIEGGVGAWIGSAALLADVPHFISEAAMFGLAVAALGWSGRDRAWVALAQGCAMALVGLAAFGEVAYRLGAAGAPSARGMGVVALLALGARLFCVWRLAPARPEDDALRTKGSWARRDATPGLLILAAAALVGLTGSAWPDMIAGAIIGVGGLMAAWRSLRVGVRAMSPPR